MAKVRGVAAIRSAIRRAPDELREEAFEEVQESTKRMHRDAVARFNRASEYAKFHHGGRGMRSISGTVRRLYRYSLSKKSLKGRVGLLSRRSAQKAFYLIFFLNGTRTQPARPVHDDAFEQERPRYESNQKAALDRVVRKLFP